MKTYKVRITAGGITKWIGENETPFVIDEAEAVVFHDSLSDFARWVLGDCQYDDFHGGKKYDDFGLEKMEFVYVTGKE
jgi:hypothetical protein